MPAMKPAYMLFYILGREGDLLEDDGVDADELAEQIMTTGADPREIIMGIATALGASAAVTDKKAFLRENRVEISDAGGDAEEAFRCYQQGRIDQYAHTVETEVVESLLEGDEEEDDDDDGDEDGDDEEENEDQG